MTAIEISVNGKKRSVPEGFTLLSLMEQSGLAPSKTVAMLNDAIIKPSGYAAAVLKDGDKLDLMSFVGGG